MTLPHADEFLLNLQANRYSDETVYNYERDLNVFNNFSEESHINFHKADKRTITHYKAYLVSRDHKTASSA